MVQNLVKIELAYINTNHPDFIRAGAAISALGKMYERKRQQHPHKGDTNGAGEEPQRKRITLKDCLRICLEGLRASQPHLGHQAVSVLTEEGLVQVAAGLVAVVVSLLVISISCWERLNWMTWSPIILQLTLPPNHLAPTQPLSWAQ